MPSALEISRKTPNFTKVQKSIRIRHVARCGVRILVGSGLCAKGKQRGDEGGEIRHGEA
jgi:hypothetical protein